MRVSEFLATSTITCLLVSVFSGCRTPASTDKPTQTAELPAQSQRPAEGKQPVQAERLWVEGDMSRVVAVTHVGPTGQDIVSLSRQDAPIGVSGVGQFLAMPGRHRLIWEPKPGEAYEAEGQAYVGIRTNSPEFFDFALVVDTPERIPARIVARSQRLRLRNPDNIFISKDFTRADNVAWFCKIEELPDDKWRFVDW